MASNYDPTRDSTRLSKQVDLVADQERTLLVELVGRDEFSLLDVGCAQGALSVARIDGLACSELVGLDPSKTAIKVAHALHPSLNWVHGELPDLLGLFDIVWTSRVVQHVGDPATFLHECWGHVSPGGQLVVVFPDDRHNVAFPAPPLLQWMLSGDFDIPNSSDRRVSEKIFAVALGLSDEVEVHAIPLASTKATPELVDVFFDWRLDALAVAKHVVLDACIEEVAHFRGQAEAGRALLFGFDTALVITKPV